MWSQGRRASCLRTTCWRKLVASPCPLTLFFAAKQTVNPLARRLTPQASVFPPSGKMTGSLSKARLKFNGNSPVGKTLPIKRPKIAVRRGYSPLLNVGPIATMRVGFTAPHRRLRIEWFSEFGSASFRRHQRPKRLPRLDGHSPRACSPKIIGRRLGSFGSAAASSHRLR